MLVTLALILIALPRRSGRAVEGRRIDWTGALLAALGLAGPVFALIEQPRLGWSAPAVMVPLIAGLVVFALFVFHEARTSDPMLPLGLFRRRNFGVGNLETLSVRTPVCPCASSCLSCSCSKSPAIRLCGPAWRRSP